MKNQNIRRKSAVCGPQSSVFRLQSLVSRRLQAAAGFTLLELLIVIALIMVLMGLLFPAFYKVVNEGKKRRSQTESSIIGTAIQAYKLRERKFPAPDADLRQGLEDVVYEGDNRRVMKLLVDATPPVLDESKLRWDAAGNAINAWDGPYKITLDLNYDGRIGGEAVEYKVE
jgi:type II secretory pathway pseudopilin PulG